MLDGASELSFVIYPRTNHKAEIVVVQVVP